MTDEDRYDIEMDVLYERTRDAEDAWFDDEAGLDDVFPEDCIDSERAIGLR